MMDKKYRTGRIACLLAAVLVLQILPGAALRAAAGSAAADTGSGILAAGAASGDAADPASGTVQDGWKTVGGRKYYYEKGRMCTGWKTISGRTYYFADSGYPGAREGSMLTGWKTIGGARFFFAGSSYPSVSEGALVTGFCTISGRTYYLADEQYPKAQKGTMLTGFKTIGGRRYYFADARYPGAKKGAMLTGFKTISGKRYYFADARRADVPRGSTLAGVQVVGKKAYYFNSNGSVNKKWRQKIVVLDPGHSSQVAGGTVPLGPGSKERKDADTLGTRGVSTGVYEYQLNLTVSLALRTELERRGYMVLMTRTKNTGTYDCIKRAKVANNNKADIFVRVHANGCSNPKRVGAMTICITKNNRFISRMYAKSKLLSEKILGSYVSATGCHREYVWKTDTMTGNNWSKVPTTLIELGYMTNAEEDRLMQTPAYQKKMVTGIANGIDAYFAEVK